MDRPVRQKLRHQGGLAMRFGSDMYWHLTSILPIAYVPLLTWYITAAGLPLAITSSDSEPLFINVQSHNSRISLVLPEKMWIGKRWSEALSWLWHHGHESP